MTRHLFSAALISLVFCSSVARGQEQPNIVWLLSEDNSKHFVQLFDETGAPTPHIEGLAEEGLLFRHAFSNSPVCSVARTTLMTGCYAPRIGTQFHRRSEVVPLPGDLRMFPFYLRQAGYYTTNNQKKDYNATEGQGVWDESSRRANWRGRSEGQPFFHMQSFATTHESSLHFELDDLASKPTVTDPREVFVPPHHPRTEIFQYTYARYHDQIQTVDEQIGEVIARLEEDGLLESTFVFYFGDHGGVLPGSKGYLYEVGLHVPLVVRVPVRFRHLVDRDLGTSVDGFVSFIDFGPTALSLAGIPVPPEMDGVPFLGAEIGAAEVDRRNEAFGYADRFDEKYDLVRSYRQGNLKYIRSFEPFNADGLQNNYRYRMLAYQQWRELHRDGSLNPAQSQFFQRRSADALYDLDNDPYERVNLIDDPLYADQRDDMRSRLVEQMTAWADLSLFPESVLVESAFDNPTQFGEDKQARIATLIRTANLSLMPFSEARPDLLDALQSSDPWARYWAFVAASCHQVADEELVIQATGTIGDADEERLVRVRAAEYLLLVDKSESADSIIRELRASRDPIEAALILNSLVMLRDGETQVDISVTAEDLHASIRETNSVQRRLEYFSAESN